MVLFCFCTCRPIVVVPFLAMYYGHTVVFLSTLEYHVNNMVYENGNQIYCRYQLRHNLNVFWCALYVLHLIVSLIIEVLREMF